MDLPSRLDLFNIGATYVTTRAKKIDPSQVYTEGSDVNLFVGVASVIGSAIINQLSARTGALTLDGSDTDDDLDRWAFDRYSGNAPRKGAAPARGWASLTRETAAQGAGSIPLGTKILSDSGAEYITTTIATFNASDLVSRARVRAVQAGRSTQVTANALRRFFDPGSIFDPTIVPSNPEPMAGGADREESDVYRNRLRAYWKAASKGLVSSIEFGALTVEGVASVSGYEIVTDNATPARVVALHIADETGVANEVMASEVKVALAEWRAGGIQVLIFTSLPTLVTLRLRLTFRANVDTDTVTTNVRAGLFDFINSLAVNAPLYRADIDTVLRRYVEDGLIVNDGTVVAPVGDLVPDIGRTLRVTYEGIEIL